MEEIMLDRDLAEDESMAVDAQDALKTRKITFAENYRNLVLILFPETRAD